MDSKSKSIVISVCIFILVASVSSSGIIAGRYGNVVAGSGGFVVDQTGGKHLLLKYSFEEPVVERKVIGNSEYDTVLMSDATCSGNPGEPNLPGKGVFILLPWGTEINEITVTPGIEVSLGVGFYVEPVGKPVPLSKMTEEMVPIPDESIYTSGDVFPKNLFTEVGVQYFRGYAIVVLRLYPVQYIPLKGELLFYPDLTVCLELKEMEKSYHPLFRGLERDCVEVGKKVDNPSYCSTYSDSNVDFGLLEMYDLLIITTDELESAFIPLQDAHNNSGVGTVIKTLADIGSSEPEVIRDFIRDEYTNHGIDFVLIGGDYDVVPACDLWVSTGVGDETVMPSDLYFGCLDGTFNFDGDARWGEPTDGPDGGDVDLIAEVYVGRACVGNVVEVGHFVNKTIVYMNYLDLYLHDALMVGELLWGNPATWGGDCMDELINGSDNNGYTTVGIPSDGYNVTTLYDRDWLGYDWPGSEIVDRINNNAYLINHAGHSWYNYSMKMNISDVDVLTNDQYCFIYTQGCNAGGFDDPEGQDCIAEYFTVKTGHGAFAGVWNARYGFGFIGSSDGPSQRFHREFWDAVFGEEIYMIGMANQDSKEDNLPLIDHICIRWCYYELNLFGDPVLSIKNISKFIRSDVNSDGSVSISDALSLLFYLYVAGETPDCMDAADVDDNGVVAMSDVVYLLRWLYIPGAPEPPPPFPDCGFDPTEDELDCCCHFCMGSFIG